MKLINFKFNQQIPLLKYYIHHASNFNFKNHNAEKILLNNKNTEIKESYKRRFSHGNNRNNANSQYFKFAIVSATALVGFGILIHD